MLPSTQRKLVSMSSYVAPTKSTSTPTRSSSPSPLLFFENNCYSASPTHRRVAPPLLLPTVDVPEDSHALGLLLRCCYPLRPPTLATLPDVRCVLQAALKYEMDAARAVAETGLKDVVDEDPVGVFAIGCRCNRQDVCQLAARRLLAHSSQSFESEELRGLSAYHYNKLTQWHMRCCLAAYGVLSRRDWFESSDVVSSKIRSLCICWVPDRKPSQWNARKFIWDYLDRARDALVTCPNSGIVISDEILGSSASWCSVFCRDCGTIPKDYPEARRSFSALLGREVERVVSEVRSISCILSVW
ncbi:hypothetical protein EVG20_g3392 [Dentipellis fragilis]|uniref:BTB domain-containing protein n=1 Tax=Dentipellis fragilis TaxID=205917 RepID=A0A4Y9Z2N1_9AGAM|nr:hypothetical protein EVG20_g3392 [Dentipellis fragilis]